MEFETLVCKRCGAAIKYSPGATHLQCEFCGTEYVLNRANSSGAAGVRAIDYLGRGTLFQAYIPEGWDCRVFSDSDSFSHLAAVCMGLRLDSSAGSSMLFYPFAYYRTPLLKTPITSRNSFDPMTLTRTRPLPAMEEYVAERIGEIFPNASDIRLRRVSDLDSFLSERAENFCVETAGKLNKQLVSRFGKYVASFTQNGVSCVALFATVLACKEQAQPEQSAQQEQPQPQNAGGKAKSFLNFYMNGGIIGAKLRGESSGMPDIKLPQLGQMKGILGHDWGRCFDAALLIRGELTSALNLVFNDFCRSVRYGSLYYALQDEELRQTEQIRLDGARQRQQNAFAASQRLRQTQNETSDIINSGYRQRSATMDNIFRKQSEAVRGVNTYTDSYGQSVEADVKYERVFQKGASYAGTTSSGFDPGADWQELKRKD